MGMSREVKITLTYGFGDQGKNGSTVLFYRVIADYSLISRLMNVVTYSSSVTVCPESILVFYYSLLFMSDPVSLIAFLAIQYSTIQQHGTMTRVEKKGGGKHVWQGRDKHPTLGWE